MVDRDTVREIITERVKKTEERVLVYNGTFIPTNNTTRYGEEFPDVESDVPQRQPEVQT